MKATLWIVEKTCSNQEIVESFPCFSQALCGDERSNQEMVESEQAWEALKKAAKGQQSRDSRKFRDGFQTSLRCLDGSRQSRDGRKSAMYSAPTRHSS